MSILAISYVQSSNLRNLSNKIKCAHCHNLQCRKIKHRKSFRQRYKCQYLQFELSILGTGEMLRTEYRSVCSFHKPDQGLHYCQLWWTVEDPGTPWLSPQISHDPAPWRSGRSGKAQWVSVRQLPHLQWRQAGMCPGPDIVLHLLQHHAPWGKTGPARRHLHPFPNRWQSLQPFASPRTHENHRETHHWAAVCWRLRPSRPHRGSPTAHHQLLLWCSQELQPRHQLEEDRCCTNPFHERHTVLLASESMAPT